MPSCRRDRAGSVLAILVLAALSGCERPSSPGGLSGPTSQPAPVVADLDVDPERGVLVVFTQPGASKVAAHFDDNALEPIREAAAALEVPVHVVDARGGVPAEVKLTPLLVYQNHRGRSVYQGRYATVERVATFLRTGRYHPQQPVDLVRQNTPIWQRGRMKIATPIKIAALTGTLPEGHDPERFTQRARAAVLQGFEKLTDAEEVRLGRADRLYYLDFYPWRSEDGALYLSVRLYSQFHCEEPVFTLPGEKLNDRWEKHEELFTRAALVLEQAMRDDMARSTIGDGFDPVPAEVATISWEALGLELPAAPEKTVQVPDGTGALAREWRVVPASPTEPAMIQYHFAPPLESYTGEVVGMRGELRLGADGALAETRGRFIAETASVRTGVEDLDTIIKSGFVLAVDDYPESTFTLERLETDGTTVRFGESVTGTMYGTFTLKEHSIPLEARTVLEPTVTVDGAPRLSLRASFTLRIDTFGLDGPDGAPEPARSTVLVDVRALLEPAGAPVDSTEVPRSLLGKPLTPIDGPDRAEWERKLADAKQAAAADPDDPDKLIWVGRYYGYLWQMTDAIEVYSRGIKRFPANAPLYRHRGHRYISLRRFDDAIADLERAVTLMKDAPDVIEQDGMPNERGIPLTTLKFNVWYHLALAHYLKGDFEPALAAWREALQYTRDYDDNLVAVHDWMYMTLCRLGRAKDAHDLIVNTSPRMDILENRAYHLRLLMYLQEKPNPETLIPETASALDIATYGYGVGNWFLVNGQPAKARATFEEVVQGPYWPAFGFIASEAELARSR